MPSSFSTIDIASEGGIFTVTLRRPSSLNAFCAEMSVELRAALRAAQRDESVRCIVLTGDGNAFCSGQDLHELQHMNAGEGRDEPLDLGAYVRESVNPIILRLRTLEKPVIAAVNGVAAGAGVGLALAADLRICAHSASFNLAFIHIGLSLDAGTSHMLLRQVGLTHASEMALLGETVSAERALAMGLVNRVVADMELREATRALASRLASLPPQALALTKRALNHAAGATLEEQLEYEAWLQTTAARTADHREGVAAFLDKRPPKFTGK